MGMCLRIPIIESSWADVPDLLLSLHKRMMVYSSSVERAEVSNLSIFLADASPEATSYHKADLTGGCVLVIGSEATGIGPQVSLN